jgi:CubicO group peptidase (beta-lactamase class C family)
MRNLLKALVILLSLNVTAQSYYFPPNGSNSWDTISPQQLGWCTQRIDSLYNMLQANGTKAFIILKNGKIVIERYFGTFTSDSPWYWASAGKTVTAFLVGMAQQENLLRISDSTSKYLGTGWTSCPADKERLITVKNQLSMTTGLDYAVADQDCKTPSCLNYKSDAGNQWYYHNAPYLLLQNVIATASGNTYNQFTNTRLNARIGTSGLWLNGVFYSRARAMARFGSLILNKGRWANDTLMHDTAYFNQMINTSQSLNEAYGYLWWLNGKSSFRLPQSTFQFNGKLFPNAPNDLIAALGKNDQKLYVVPSLNMVVVRMGESSDLSPVPVVLDTLIWHELNQIICQTTQSINTSQLPDFSVWPNPSTGSVTIEGSGMSDEMRITITDSRGKVVKYQRNDNTIELQQHDAGLYFITVETPHGKAVRKWIVVE